MPCCGKTKAAPDARAAAAPRAHAVTPRGTPAHSSVFEYQGGRVLTVIGQGTGHEYRFVGFGARVPVDARDRASLSAMPMLREIRPAAAS